MAATRVGDRRGAERVAFGAYDLLQLVAATRLGGVHRGESNDASKPRAALAIKWLKPQHSCDPAIAACFTDVMERTRRLEHAGFCAVVDVGRAPDDSLFAALEWVNGKDWKRIVATLRKQGTTMPPTLVAYVGMRAAQALEAAHRPSPNRKLAPLYHGELSGADILIGYDGRVKVNGLGAGALAAAAQLPHVRTAFRAPELARGAACNAQSDVFSLGACLYQALTLTAPSVHQPSDKEAADKPESMIRHIVPAALLEIVRKAVAEDPGVRFGSAGALANALAHWASTQSSPGDARALSAFMTSIFEQSRSGPMNDPRDDTPAQPLRARRLAAMTRAPVPEEAIATTPAPVAPVGERPAPAAVLPSAAAPVSAEESWESDPWENAHGAQGAWSVTPATPPVITTRPPAMPARTRSPMPVAPVPQALPAPRVARPLPAAALPLVALPAVAPPPVALPTDDVFSPLATSTRAAWRVPVFVAASAVLVIGALLALRAPEPAPPEPQATGAATALAPAQRTEPVAPEPAPPEPVEAQVAAKAAAAPTAPSIAAPATRPAHASTGRSEPREVRRPTYVEGETARDAFASVEPSAGPSESVEAPEPVAAPADSWVPPTRPVIAATSTPLAAPPPAAAAEAAATREPQSSKATVVRAAEAIAQPSPDFPTRAKRRGVTEGTVTIEYTVDETGAVRDPRVMASQPKGLFDEASLSALARWKYRPKLVDGKPVASRRSFTFRFQ